MTSFRKRFYVYSLLAALAIVTVALSLRIHLIGLPPITSLESYTPSLTTRIFDSKGLVLAELFTERRALLPLSKIPVDLQNAIIAVEDDQFFHHAGISIKGILRAAWRNFWAGRVLQGGSTITQQLSKLIFLNPERSISRKIREVLMALQIERNFSKQEILQMYLNQVYFGQGAYGVQAAARIFFGKEVGDLTLPECALLGGMVRAPSGYSPFNHPDRARVRRNVVLVRMREEGFITPEEEKRAAREPIPLIRPPLLGTQAPYFAEQIRRELEPKYGFTALWKGGLRITTTLDLEMQKHAEEIMEESLKAYDEEAARYRAKTRDADVDPDSEEAAVQTSTLPIQGALVVLDVRTGAIRAMVGGRDYMASAFNRVTQAHRQPGSTFKPFVWGAALSAGYTPATLVDDGPLAYYYEGRDWRLFEGTTEQFAISLVTATFATSRDFKIWVPTNFDAKFMGVVTMRRALELSRNVVSVRLIQSVGPTPVADLAHRAGIQSDLEQVLSLGLGTSVVTPLELTSALGTFANGGVHVTPFAIQRVEDAQGRLLEDHAPVEREAVSPQIAYVLVNMMKGVVENGTARYARKLGRPLAGKTGTTQDNRDLWFIGMTPDLVAGAWMGYDQESLSLPRRDWTGGSTVVPWWTKVMTEALKGYPSQDFPVPDGIAFVKIDAETGDLALPTCPKQRLEAFIKGSEPKVYCKVDHSKPLELVSVVPSTIAPMGLTPFTTGPRPARSDLEQAQDNTTGPADDEPPLEDLPQ